ncbi:MAG: flagellar basal body P-ring protein FlgI, partial [Planctomycetota bacterium]
MKPTRSRRADRPGNAIVMAAIGLCTLISSAGRCERIKDIVDIQGLRSNPLTGVGLVIGLDGSGDSTLLSAQMLTNLLR